MTSKVASILDRWRPRTTVARPTRPTAIAHQHDVIRAAKRSELGRPRVLARDARDDQVAARVLRGLRAGREPLGRGAAANRRGGRPHRVAAAPRVLPEIGVEAVE